MNAAWLADRMQHFADTAYQEVFALSKNLKNPIALHAGQPHYPVPEEILNAAKQALDEGKNAYTLAEGIPALREVIGGDVRRRLGQADRDVIITPGTLGALTLAMQCFVNPGDEVILFDPFFLAYRPIIGMVGGVPVLVDTYPDFMIDPDKLKAAITPRTKMILVCSPGNPTGVVQPAAVQQAIARLAAEHHVLLVSDEIYAMFCYDAPFASPAASNPETLVVSSFSKTHAVTGWRLGYAHGPKALIEAMTKVQQFTTVNASSIAQHAGVAAYTHDMNWHVADYRHKRDLVQKKLDPAYRAGRPGGAFYFFLPVPWGSGTSFVKECIANNLLVLPGRIFSQRDTHFRLSYAADDTTIERGLDVLNRLVFQTMA
jgi:aspartate aminotransferase/aminotransferase